MKRVLLLMAVLLLLMGALTCAGVVGLIYLAPSTPVQPAPAVTRPQPAPTPDQPPEAVQEGSTAAQQAEAPTPRVEDYERWVISTIKQNPPVHDVTIEHDGDRIQLVLILEEGTAVEEARRLGDNLVRLAKLFAEPDAGPGQFIGTGYYDYFVFVYLGEHQLFEGRKADHNDRIRWIIYRPQ